MVFKSNPVYLGEAPPNFGTRTDLYKAELAAQEVVLPNVTPISGATQAESIPFLTEYDGSFSFLAIGMVLLSFCALYWSLYSEDVPVNESTNMHMQSGIEQLTTLLAEREAREDILDQEEEKNEVKVSPTPE